MTAADLELVAGVLQRRVGAPAAELGQISQPIQLSQLSQLSQERWNGVLQLAERHGVFPLLYPLVADHLPATIRAGRDALYQAHAARCAAMTSELARLLKDLESAGQRALAYKGPALAARAFGSTVARGFVDLDILVRRDDLPAVRRRLQALGYRPAQSSPVPDPLLFGSECDETFLHDQRAVALEVHWAVAPPWLRFPVTTESLLERAVPVEAPPLRAASPGDEDMVLLLCLNGAKDGWPKLEPLCSLAALVARRPDFDWDQLLANAARLHTRRMLHLGLLLASRLGFLMVPPAAAASVQADRGATALADRVRQRWTAPAAPTDKLWFAISTRERWRDRVGSVLTRALRPTRDDAAFFPLPGTLTPLYALVRPYRLLTARFRRRNK
jgi:hypothetical protein